MATKRAIYRQKELSAEQRKQAQRLYEEAQRTQTAFWYALRQLELHLGFEVDGMEDLQETSLDSILEFSDGRAAV